MLEELITEQLKKSLNADVYVLACPPMLGLLDKAQAVRLQRAPAVHVFTKSTQPGKRAGRRRQVAHSVYVIPVVRSVVQNQQANELVNRELNQLADTVKDVLDGWCLDSAPYFDELEWVNALDVNYALQFAQHPLVFSTTFFRGSH